MSRPSASTSSCSSGGGGGERSPSGSFDVGTAANGTPGHRVPTGRVSYSAGDDLKSLASLPNGGVIGEGLVLNSPPGGFASRREVDHDQMGDTSVCGSGGSDGGSSGGCGGGGEGVCVAGVSEWMMTFSSCLEHGVTHVKVTYGIDNLIVLFSKILHVCQSLCACLFCVCFVEHAFC